MEKFKKNLFFVFIFNLKAFVDTASFCMGYQACGSTKCSPSLLANISTQNNPLMISYYCGSGSFYCAVRNTFVNLI